MRLAAKANAIQIAATNQTFSSIERLPQNTSMRFVGVISSEFGQSSFPFLTEWQTPLPHTQSTLFRPLKARFMKELGCLIAAAKKPGSGSRWRQTLYRTGARQRL